MDMTLTDGGIETQIIYEFRRPIGDFEAYKLLGDEAGRGILRRIYQSYAEVAVRYSLPIQLGTPTWRASRKWTPDVESLNTAAVELLRTVMKQYAGAGIILAGGDQAGVRWLRDGRGPECRRCFCLPSRPS
jgi:hypothetical protein